MTPKELSAKMYRDFRGGDNDFHSYNDEQIMSAHNFIEEVHAFMSMTGNHIVVAGLSPFRLHLINILNVRGRFK